MHRMFSNQYLVDHKRLIQALDRKHRAAGTAFSADQSGARDTAQTLKKGAAVRGVLARDASLNELVKLFSTVGQVAHDAGMTKFTPFTKSMDATRGAKRMGRDQFASPSYQPVDLDPEAVHAILTLVAEQDGGVDFNVGEEGEEGEEGEISEMRDSRKPPAGMSAVPSGSAACPTAGIRWPATRPDITAASPMLAGSASSLATLLLRPGTMLLVASSMAGRPPALREVVGDRARPRWQWTPGPAPRRRIDFERLGPAYRPYRPVVRISHGNPSFTSSRNRAAFRATRELAQPSRTFAIWRPRLRQSRTPSRRLKRRDAVARRYSKLPMKKSRKRRRLLPMPWSPKRWAVHPAHPST